MADALGRADTICGTTIATGGFRSTTGLSQDTEIASAEVCTLVRIPQKLPATNHMCT